MKGSRQHDATQPPDWEVPRERHAARVWAVGVAALVVLGAVALAGRGEQDLVVEPERPDPDSPTPTPDPVSAWRSSARTVGSWSTLPAAPLTARADPVAVWTGATDRLASRGDGEVVVWGGSAGTGGHADGAAYRPSAGEWRPIADAPHAWRSGSTLAATWTGEELFTLVALDDAVVGMAYDPSADRWRETAPPPSDLAAWQASGWTGSEVVVFGSAHGRQAPLAVAYDPDGARWRPVPTPPVTDDGGSLLVAELPAGLAVFGEVDGHPAMSLLDDGAWTDPDPLPATGAGTAHASLAATVAAPEQDRLVLVGRSRAEHRLHRTWSWSAADGWAARPNLRVGGTATRMHIAWTGAHVVAWTGDGDRPGGILTSDASWQALALPPFGPRAGAAVVWTGRQLVVWGGHAEGEPLADGAAFHPWQGLSEGRLRTGG